MSETSRVYFRLPCEFKIRYQKEKKDGAKPGTARTCDISTNGVAFLTNVSFPIGEVLHVSFRLPRHWHAFRIKAEVRHQTIRRTTPEVVYLTGVQFAPDTAASMIEEIGNFIVRKTNFLTIRVIVPCIAVLLALIAVARGFNINLIHYYLGTPAGTEWFPSGGWWHSILKIYIIGNLVLALALIADGIAFAMIRRHTRKIMSVLLLVSALAQIGRLIFKAGFFGKDFFFQWIYSAEILILAVCIGLFLLLTRKKFVLRFDSYRQNLENHLLHA